MQPQRFRSEWWSWLGQLKEKAHWTDEDIFIISANPRFAAVAQNALSRSELATVREKINRLSSPSSQNQTWEEGLLRFYLPKIEGTLQQLQIAETGGGALDTTDMQMAVPNQIANRPLPHELVLTDNPRTASRRQFKIEFKDKDSAWQLLRLLVKALPWLLSNT